MPNQAWWEQHRLELLRLGRVTFAQKYHLALGTVKHRWGQLDLPPLSNHRVEWWEAHRAEISSCSFSAFYEAHKDVDKVTVADLEFWRRRWGVVDKEMSARFKAAHQYGRAWWEAHSKDLAEMPTASFVEKYETSATTVSVWRKELGIIPPQKRIYKQNLVGQRFGRLVVIEKTSQKDKGGTCYLYRCHCDCGRETLAISTSLKNGNVRSCGCLRQDIRRRDVTGQTFGYLTAIEPTEHIKNHSVIWRWRCSCGAVIEAPLDSVLYSGRRSCGCESQKLKTKQITNARKSVEWIDGTCVNRIRSNKLQSTNTSGVRGVSWHKGMGKWLARIMFKGHSYTLGYYTELEDAAAARHKAEKMYFEDFLKWYDAENANKGTI